MSKIYLDDIPLEEARNRLQEKIQAAGLWRRLGVDRLALDENLVGRILAGTLWARISSPHYHASAMDGFAVKSERTHGALETAPITLQFDIDTTYLDTGDPLPEWADAVIPIENVVPLDTQGDTATDPRHPAAIQIRAAVSPWSHVRVMGEDMVATQLVLPQGHRLKPVDLGAAAGAGGIGFELFMASGFYFDLREVGFITYAILIVAFLLEVISTRLKRRYFPVTSD